MTDRTIFGAGDLRHSAEPECREAVNTLLPVHALEVLYRREYSELLANLSRKVGSEHACDIAQEVFLRAAANRNLTRLRKPGAFLHRIAHNLLIDEARRRACRIRTLPLDERREASCAPEQENTIEVEELAERLRKALAGLPPKTTRIFSMNRFEKKSYRQIHRELGIALQTVDYHMMRALAHLRAELGDCGTTKERRKNNFV
ncbi:MAG: RNA polymerase sigma factor [Qipengyuania pacifica]|jgi:RNA polymerase sigma factor (sigma-70 family)|tara:strand:+ start:5697 stop:6305 length:609 start_codon:yes stop_codon:yes gene_type:complete